MTTQPFSQGEKLIDVIGKEASDKLQDDIIDGLDRMGISAHLEGSKIVLDIESSERP